MRGKKLPQANSKEKNLVIGKNRNIFLSSPEDMLIDVREREEGREGWVRETSISCPYTPPNQRPSPHLGICLDQNRTYKLSVYRTMLLAMQPHLPGHV